MDAAFGLEQTPAWMIHDYADSANEVRLLIKLGETSPEEFGATMDGVTLLEEGEL